MVILPVLFLPPVRFTDTNNDFSGLFLEISEKSGAVLKRCPGVIGLNFFTLICLMIDYELLAAYE
jgi:hypothetical protein